MTTDLLTAVDLTDPATFLGADLPSMGRRHREIRNLLLKPFAPRALASVVAGVRRRTDRLVAEAVERGRVDFARDVAEQIPMATIADLLGVPPADRPYLLTLTKQALSSEEAGQTAEDSRLARNE